MKTCVANANTCFKEKSLLSDTNKRVCTIFSLPLKLVSSVFVLWVFKGFSICFWQRLQHLLKKRESLNVFFFFGGGSSFWRRKFLPNKSVFIITTQPIVFLLDFASIFRVNLRIIIISLRKWQVLFKKPAFWEKANISDQETWELFLFFAQI